MIVLSKSDKDKYHIIFMWNLKNNTNELLYKTKTDSQTQEINLWLLKGKGGGINKEFGINRYILLYVKQIANKDPLNSTGNSVQYLVIAHNGKEPEKDIYVCMYMYN